MTWTIKILLKLSYYKVHKVSTCEAQHSTLDNKYCAQLLSMSIFKDIFECKEKLKD